MLRPLVPLGYTLHSLLGPTRINFHMICLKALMEGAKLFHLIIVEEKKNFLKNPCFTLNQEFGREKDENRADLCLRSIVFSFESGCL